MVERQMIRQLPVPPERPAEAHKGTFGSVLILAGSRSMPGAACLTGRAALHGGVGLCTVAIPHCIADVVAGSHPSYMTLPLSINDDGSLSDEALETVTGALARMTAVGIGPGLGQSAAVRHMVHRLYKQTSLPMVVDADGLNAFAGDAELLGERSNMAPRVVTPHPGEFARLTNSDTKTVQQRREEMAVQFAQRHQLVLLLKGAKTIVTDGHKVAINQTGDVGLATGGSGDVLTGLVASLLAQGMNAFDAAQYAAHLHGLAGEIMSESLSDRYATSADLLNFLSPAWQRLTR